MAIVTFLFISIPVFADIVEPSLTSKCTYLENIGFPQSYIKERSKLEIDSLYADLYGTDSWLISLEYSKLTETPETDSGIVPYGNISSSVMEFSVAVVQTINSNTHQVVSAMVYANWQWKSGRPNIKRTDAISVNWDPSLFVLKSGSFSSTIQDKYGDGAMEYTLIDKITSPDTATQGGVGVSVPLHLYNPNDHYGKLSGCVRLKLLPSHTIYNNNADRVSSVNAVYIHDPQIFHNTSFTFDITENSHVTISAPSTFDSVAATGNTYYREP